ncbi:MAG: polysaccharide biosynthesis/export family protein [Pseudomonadota bacterium]
MRYLGNASRHAVSKRIGAGLLALAIGAIAPATAQEVTIEQEDLDLPLDVTEQELPPEEYRIRNGDQLQIIVLEDPELSRGALVRPDGRINIPIAGTIDAEGRTPTELQETIRSRLSGNFIEPPTVTVAPTNIVPLPQGTRQAVGRNQFYIVGEVPRPGRYAFTDERPVSILQAITMAGGVGPFAATTRIQIREVIDDVETLRLFDYDRVLDGELRPSQDLAVLTNGTVIIVPERGLFE